MKIIFLSFFLVVGISYTARAQDFQGKAMYDLKITDIPGFDGNDISEPDRTNIINRMKRGMEKSFSLTFDRTASLYQQIEKQLIAPPPPPPPSAGGSKWTVVGVSKSAVVGSPIFSGAGYDTGQLYINSTDKEYVKEASISNKLFLIKDELKQPDWKMEGETKKIGKYICYKATLTTPINNASNAAHKDNNLPETPTEKTITAWYTLDIAVGHGPGDYWGLPGLILEVELEGRKLVCSEIILNPAEKIEIKAPEKGKVINQKDFDNILAKKNVKTSQTMQVIEVRR
ncbi:GLPGLI family protein [Cellulophaga sp. F20128]|uniref:GLPGLI family protein n=1 Tax=Cellulophaga sp. F20128 TaxID=2926413 RepID=UPI001FF5AC26|nr:GLPGLI family protein [Cellulophaga sp. F20128]MCK0156012.1 GLPGLI family protein [Cellulophaga sp. F20128]